MTTLDARPVSSWFVVYVEPSHEQISATLLTESGYQVFLPKYRKWIVMRDRRKQIELPLFTRYLFCRLTTRVSARVLGTPGVVKLIGFRDGNGAIQDAEIELLRKLEATGASPFKGLAIGTRVRVLNGALKGMEGIFVRKGKDEKNRLVLSIDLIQRSIAVELDNFDVEPV
jgi:transcription antitermination factor NusG